MTSTPNNNNDAQRSSRSSSRSSSPRFELSSAMSGLVLVDNVDLEKIGTPLARTPTLVLLGLTKHEKEEHQNAINNNEINLEIDSDDEQRMQSFLRNTKEALPSLFTEFDLDGNGHIDPEELLVFLHSVPIKAGIILPSEFTKEEGKLCMRGFDIDNNGTIEEDELMMWISDGLAKNDAERKTFSESSPFAAKMNIFLSAASKVIAEYSYYQKLKINSATERNFNAGDAGEVVGGESTEIDIDDITIGVLHNLNHS